METRYAPDPVRFERMNTAEIRQHFLIDDLFAPGQVKLVYWHTDRMIIGSITPTTAPLTLEAGQELRANYFAERREIGVINLGGEGQIKVDGVTYSLAKRTPCISGGAAGRSSLAAWPLPTRPDFTWSACPPTRLIRSNWRKRRPSKQPPWAARPRPTNANSTR